MAVRRLTPEQRRALTRDTLLDAAAEVFARRGYEAASLEEIADLAGFTKGAIYSNFGGREPLFIATLRRRNERLLDAYRRFLADAHEHRATPAEVARVWTEHELADRQSLMLMLEFRLAALRNDAVRAVLADFERETETLVAGFITERLADADQAIAVDVQDLAAILYAANQGLVQHAAVCATDHDDLFARFLDLIIQGAAPSPSPTRRKAAPRRARTSEARTRS